MVGRTIADISNPRPHIYRGAQCRGKYAAEVGHGGYGLTYHTIYDILYGECATDEPFCVRQPSIFETMPFFTHHFSLCLILNLVTMRNFLWLHNHHMIFFATLTKNLVQTLFDT